MPERPTGDDCQTSSARVMLAGHILNFENPEKSIKALFLPTTPKTHFYQKLFPSFSTHYKNHNKNCRRVFAEKEISSTFALPKRRKNSERNASGPLLKGSLAQLVQSICLTSRGSGVRIPQLPQKKSHSLEWLFYYTCIHTAPKLKTFLTDKSS